MYRGDLTNEELCVLARQGDTPAENELVERISASIRAIAYCLYRAEKDVNLMLGVSGDDLTQVGYEAAWNCIEKYDPAKGASFKTYAGDCAKNAMISYLRKQEGLFDAYEFMYDKADCEDVAPVQRIDFRKDPEIVIIQLETDREFCDALLRLPPREREFFCSWMGFDSDNKIISINKLVKKHGLKKAEVERLQQSIRMQLWDSLHALWPCLKSYPYKLQSRLLRTLREELARKIQIEKEIKQND